jgi:hypothetical protein
MIKAKKEKKPKLRSCKYRPCRKKFVRERADQEVCSIECAILRAKDDLRKAEKKEDARIKREYYENRRTLTNWLDYLQDFVNTIILLIDFKQPCIATGAVTGKKNAGHFYAKNAIPAIRFNLHNLHLQSEHSNNWKRGDPHRYKEGLIYVYGQAYWELVENLNATPDPELTIDQVKEKINIAKGIGKELRKHKGKVYSTPERIALRFKYNSVLGIYGELSATAGLPSTWGNTTDDLPF